MLGAGARVGEILRLGGPAWLVVLASLALSMLSVYSIDVAENVRATGELGKTAYKQLFFAGVGMMGAVLIALPHYRWLGSASWALLGISVALLIFLLIPFVPSSIVRPRNGARCWIDLGPVDFQPSEVAKIAYVLVIAWYLRFRKNHRNFLGLVPPAIITFVPVGADHGAAGAWDGAALYSGAGGDLDRGGGEAQASDGDCADCDDGGAGGVSAVDAAPEGADQGMLLQMKGDSTADQDINMQSVTAQRLVGAGDALGGGSEKARTLLHFNALPERHTDMIFAVVCSRFGMMGGLATMGLYLVWFIGALLTAATCREPFGRLVVVGLTGFMAAQVIVNIGMNLGLVPIIGITLPFLSDGGSCMVTVWLMTGLIVSIAVRPPRMMMRHSFEFDGEE